MLRSSAARSALLVCVCAASLAAQVPSRGDSVANLPSISTTATRTASEVLSTPLAITKITADELRMERGYGLEDALKKVPGVIAQSRYGTSDVRLIIRGYGARGAGDRSNSGTSRGVRVLLDGFPETEPDGRTAFDDIDLATAEAVEVVRSNASALWGNAAGGVVNIFSVPTVSEPSLEVQPLFGRFGLKRLAVRAAAPVSEGAMWASFTNSTFTGWRKHSDARRALLNAGVTGQLTDATRLGVYLVAANNLMHIPGPLTQAELDADPTQANPTYALRDERRYNRQGRLGFTLDYTLDEKTSVSSMFFVNPKYLQRSERNTYRDFTRYHLGGNVVGRRELSVGRTRHQLSAGVDEAYQDGSIQFYALGPGSTRGALSDNKGEGAQNVGVFLQDQLGLGERLNLLLGARYDRVAYTYRTFFDPNAVVKRQSKDFDRVSPKVGINWMIGRTASVYANVGGGIEVPAGNETDQPPTGPLPGALLNPLLDAISSTTYEVGHKSLAVSVGPATLGYDVALYNIEVKNEIIPYNGGRYYQTAARARRNGAEIGIDLETVGGIFGRTALTFNNHRYVRYIVDSSVINAANTGRVDLSNKRVMGVPNSLADVELGVAVPRVPRLVLKAGMEYSGSYFADDANTISVPSFTIFNLTAALRQPIVAANGWGIGGFITLHNVADRTYIGSAFLNPDPGANGQPAVFEPGMPRTIIVSLTAGRTR